MHHLPLLPLYCTHTQAHMEATSFVICIRVSLHCCSMFKPHLIKWWLPCFLSSHMLPIRSRQTGSLPKVLRSRVQREQETLRSPPKAPYQSTEFLVRPSAERFWIESVSATKLSLTSSHSVEARSVYDWPCAMINSNLLAAHTWWRRYCWGAWYHLCWPNRTTLELVVLLWICIREKEVEKTLVHMLSKESQRAAKIELCVKLCLFCKPLTRANENECNCSSRTSN